MVGVGEAAPVLNPPMLDNQGRHAGRTARTGWTVLSQAVSWGSEVVWTYLDLLKLLFPFQEREKHEVSVAEPFGIRA